MLHVIEEAHAEQGYALRLRFADGCSGTVDLTELVARGGVFEELRDPAVFARVCVGQAGRSLQWPGDIDLCADALHRTIAEDRD